jgi:hypothetical protein
LLCAPLRTGYVCFGSHSTNFPVITSDSGAKFADHRAASGSSQVASSWCSSSAQPQPYGRDGGVRVRNVSASTARLSAVKCSSSAERISAAGTRSGTVRSSRTSIQCISTHECQSKQP